MTAPSGSSRAEALRRAFDESFARPPAVADDDEPLLAIRVAGEVLAVRLSDVTAVVADRAIVALPGAPADLLGLVAHRGDLLPVHALAALLGKASSAAARRTLLLVDRASPVAFAVERLEGHVRIPRDRTRRAARGGDAELVATADDAEGRTWLIVDLVELVRTLRARSTAAPRGGGGGR